MLVTVEYFETQSANKITNSIENILRGAIALITEIISAISGRATKEKHNSLGAG